MGDVRCRTVWISDVHLGTRECAADALLAFLDRHHCEYLYLVGDIVDFWQLGPTPYWPQIQTDVVRKVLSKARAGTIVTIIPGNHDEYLRRFCDLQLGNIMITREAIHRTADGRLLLDPARRSSAVTVVERLFHTFKGLQFGVFIAWCNAHGGRFPFPAPHGPFVTVLCWTLAGAGQVLVVSTFYQLGRTGVFFGDQLGHAVPRCRAFPFSLLSHPQYVGTLLTIWGGFMLVRFPHDDWWAFSRPSTIRAGCGSRRRAAATGRGTPRSPSGCGRGRRA